MTTDKPTCDTQSLCVVAHDGVHCSGLCPSLNPYGGKNSLLAKCTLLGVDLTWYDYWIAQCIQCTSTAPTQKLLPCPHCGATEEELDKKNGRGIYAYLNSPASGIVPWLHVACLQCGSGSPSIESWNRRIGDKTEECWAILDTFHPSINGDKTPEVRSDHPCWNGDINEFFSWCRQHGADGKWYRVPKIDKET